jgi:L-fucose isomerase-like protein
MSTNNSPIVKLALVGVSRDCFPVELTRRRLARLAAECDKLGLDAYAAESVIESEADSVKALAEVRGQGCNAAVIYLGNFGPEGPTAIFAQRFPGPVMACAAAEESGDNLVTGRGDALCGLLNASYNFNLRSVRVHIPERPVGLPDELAARIAEFVPVAQILLGLAGVKVFAFGPRPQDFYACNAPIGPLYRLGVEVMENSELDLLQAVEAIDLDEPEVRQISQAMADELGEGNAYPDLLPRLARLELALKRFAADNLGSRQFAVFANKCWPAFEKAFGFVPCYVNGRLAAQGMPVACEVDIYGALSEYMAQLASDATATLLDINNSVPQDMIAGADLKGASAEDLFMGFHCGNASAGCMKNCSMKYQLIMNRLMEEPGGEPDITRGTLEGQLMPGPTTLFRLQGTAEGELASYVGQGEILDIDPRSFGSIGVIAIPGFARFYRHVLVGRHFPHHSAVAFSRCAAPLLEAVKLMGVADISWPLPATQPYPTENPFV